jgi:hypothetical protein
MGDLGLLYDNCGVVVLLEIAQNHISVAVLSLA